MFRLPLSCWFGRGVRSLARGSTAWRTSSPGLPFDGGRDMHACASPQPQPQSTFLLPPSPASVCPSCPTTSPTQERAVTGEKHARARSGQVGRRRGRKEEEEEEEEEEGGGGRSRRDGSGKSTDAWVGRWPSVEAGGERWMDGWKRKEG